MEAVTKAVYAKLKALEGKALLLVAVDEGGGDDQFYFVFEGMTAVCINSDGYPSVVLDGTAVCKKLLDERRAEHEMLNGLDTLLKKERPDGEPRAAKVAPSSGDQAAPTGAEPGAPSSA